MWLLQQTEIFLSARGLQLQYILPMGPAKLLLERSARQTLLLFPHRVKYSLSTALITMFRLLIQTIHRATVLVTASEVSALPQASSVSQLAFPTRNCPASLRSLIVATAGSSFSQLKVPTRKASALSDPGRSNSPRHNLFPLNTAQIRPPSRESMLLIRFRARFRSLTAPPESLSAISAATE